VPFRLCLHFLFTMYDHILCCRVSQSSSRASLTPEASLAPGDILSTNSHRFIQPQIDLSLQHVGLTADVVNLGPVGSPLPNPVYVGTVLLRFNVVSLKTGNFAYIAFWNVGLGATATAPTKSSLYAMFETGVADQRLVLSWSDDSTSATTALLTSSAISASTSTSFDCSFGGHPNYCAGSDTRPRGGGVDADGKVMFFWHSGTIAGRPKSYIVGLLTDMVSSVSIIFVAGGSQPAWNPAVASDASGSVFLTYDNIFIVGDFPYILRGMTSFRLGERGGTRNWFVNSNRLSINGPTNDPNRHGEIYRMRPVHWTHGSNQLVANAAYFLGGNCAKAPTPCANAFPFLILLGNVVNLRVDIVAEETFLPVQTPACKSVNLVSVDAAPWEGTRAQVGGTTLKSFAGSYRAVFANPTTCQIVSMNTMAGSITILPNSQFSLNLADSSATLRIVLKVSPMQVFVKFVRMLFAKMDQLSMR